MYAYGACARSSVVVCVSRARSFAYAYKRAATAELLSSHFLSRRDLFAWTSSSAHSHSSPRRVHTSQVID